VKPIGGYFELELGTQGDSFHNEALVGLKSGRACLRLMLEHVRPSLVWVPYYVCDSVLQPFRSTRVRYQFYALDERLEIAGGLPALGSGEVLLYVDYFGLKGTYASQLVDRYGKNVWLDETQAFFVKPLPPRTWSYNSARKFFGVPDGAYVYGPEGIASVVASRFRRNDRYRLEHLVMRLEGRHEVGYPYFRENEQLHDDRVELMSILSERLLSRVDYASVAATRRANFEYLHRRLGGDNTVQADLLSLDEVSVPFCYPFLPKRQVDRRRLWEQQVFVPILWKECLERDGRESFPLEMAISSEMLPLPVDHRYGVADMERMCRAILCA